MADKFRPLILLFIAVIVVEVVAGFIVYSSFSDMSTRGTFGDMFGVVNALFSGLAFAGVIYAILLQRKELELQRKELELTRKELARSANAQQQSSKILGQQLSIMKQNFHFELEKSTHSAQPLLQQVGDTNSPKDGYKSFHVKNLGATVTEVSAVPKDAFKIGIAKSTIKTNDKIKLWLEYDFSTKPRFQFELLYTDSLGIKRKQIYEHTTTGLIQLDEKRT